MIKRLKLKNFKKHSDLDVTFTEGLQGVFGKNYAGKSTILHGILFCLGGASAVPGSNLQRNGTNTGFKQEMWLTIGGKDYYIVRTKTQARLFLGEGEDGEMIAAGTSPVNEKISDLLGMSMKRFQQLRYASQKKTDAMLTLGASELHKIIEELSGADKIDSALGKLKDMVTFESGKIEGMVEVDEKVIETQIKEVTDNLQTTEHEKHKLLKVVEDTDKQLEDVRKNVSEIESLVAKNERLGRQIDRELWQVEQNEKELESASEQLASYRVWEDDYVETLTTETNRLNAVLQQLQNATNEVSDTRRNLERAEKRLEEERDVGVYIPSFDPVRLEEAEESYSKIKSHVDSLKNKEKEFNNAIDGGACNACGRPYDGVDVPALMEKLRSVQSQLAVEMDELVEVYDLLKKLKAEEKKYTHAQASKAAHDRSLQRLEKEHAEALLATETAVTAYDKLCGEHGSPDELKSAYDVVRGEYQAYLNDTEEVKKLQRAVETHSNDLKYSQKNLAKLKSQLVVVDQSLLGSLKSKIENLIENLTSKRVRLAEVRSEINQEDARLVMLTEKLDNAKKSNALITSSKSKLNGCKALQKYLRENRDRYMSDVWAGFMAQASDFASACTGGAIEGLVRTEDGKFQFIENGFDMDMKSASGAQSSIMGLGVQMALADATACPVDVVLVDEPTADMDPEHSMATAAMLAANGRQVICVSHSQMDSSVCNNVITVGE
ncbi:AAA family ATPase [Endozoicomonas sp. ALC066]|uniref:AAA family ATPase n=1 Tax=Endozoicomonas sp. ALC066 TaxID=3403078 RepID=UPI003BB61906